MVIDFGDLDPFTDNIEEYCNARGCTLGDRAEELQKLMEAIMYCYLEDVAGSQVTKDMNKRFMKLIKANIKVKE